MKTKQYSQFPQNSFSKLTDRLSSGIQDARFVQFGTGQLDVPESQNRCSL